MTPLSLSNLEELARGADPKRNMGEWYVVEQPWLPPGCEPYIVAGNPDPHAGKYVCDFVEVDIAGHEDEFTDDEWTSRNWALATFIAAANPTTILTLISDLREARNAALEEAAVFVETIARAYENEGMPGTHWKNVASGIRSLKTPPTEATV